MDVPPGTKDTLLTYTPRVLAAYGITLHGRVPGAVVLISCHRRLLHARSEINQKNAIFMAVIKPCALIDCAALAGRSSLFSRPVIVPLCMFARVNCLI